jgi:adenosylcobinamide kinase/adenosylcobinamide-phosphate guanylyltransferase
MILMIGGAHQGKRRIAREMLRVDEREFQSQLVDGDSDDLTLNPESWPVAACVASYHTIIRRVIDAGGDPDEFTKRLILSQPQIVIMDEVGYGIVPMDRKERDYREAVGRAGQMLAAEADHVYRVICGIAQCIKSPEQT